MTAVGPKPGTPYKCYHGLGFNCKTCWPTAEPTMPAVWPFKNCPGKAAHEVHYSEPPPPTFRPSDEDEALL